MRLLIVTFIFAAWGLASLVRPALAAGLLLWVDISAPLEIAYSTGAYPISMMALGVLVVSFTVNLAIRGFRPRLTFFFWMWLAFFGWVTVSMALSPFPESAGKGVIDMLKYLGPLLLVSISSRDQKDARILAYILAGSLGIWGAQIGLWCLFNGMNNFMHIAGTQMGDNNFLSAGVVAILPILLFAATDYEGKFKRIVRAGWTVALVLCLSTVVFSNSRGAALGLFGNVVIYLTLISKNRMRDIGIAIGLGTVILLMLPESFWDRMSTLQDVGTERAESSAAERLLLLKSTFRAVQDYPVFGVGPNCWVNVSTSYTGLEQAMQPHNIWLKCAVELGYPGLFLFLSLIVGTIIRLLRVRSAAYRAGQVRTAKMALALASCQIGYIISLTFLSNYDLEFQWAWLAIGNAFVANWKANGAVDSAAAPKTKRRGGKLAERMRRAMPSAPPPAVAGEA